jgi:hypothetical protein
VSTGHEIQRESGHTAAVHAADSAPTIVMAPDLGLWQRPALIAGAA